MSILVPAIFTVLHLFSGSGGLAKGFHDAGFTSAGNIDMDPRACVDLRNLCGTAAIEADIGAMEPADLRALVPECPDVAASSSPCVGFSGCLPEATSKTAKYQDFNSLALHGVWLLLEAWKGATTGRKVPGMIVFENVPRIMTRGKKLLEHLVGLLHAEGYAVDMRTHDCGELGRGLAQKRRRFLLVARHMQTVQDFLRKPPAYSPLAIREVLWQLPPPRPGGPDHMHRLPSLSAKNWLRLACICAGGDWRDLPAEVWIYHCESADLEAVTGIRWNHCVGRHDGKLGVLDWERPSKTIIGKARVCNTWNSVADPRVDWPATTHGGRPDCYGMTDERRPSGTVRGEQTIYSSKASTPDPRVETAIPERKQRKNGGRGVEASDEAAHAILGEGSVSNTRASVADARVDTSYPRGEAAKSGILGVQAAEDPSRTILGATTIRNSPASVTDPRLIRPQRSDAYGVQGADQPSGTIVGHHQHDNVAGSVADARVAVELGHTPRRGSMGVQASDGPSDVVRGNHSIRQAPGAVDDPRVGRRSKTAKAPRAAKPKKPAKPSLPRLYNERGWPVATHYLVQLDDGRLVLYGPPVDFSDPRPRADLVIVALDGTLHRPFTDEELALLMGFPLGFVFCGPSSCSKTKEGAPLKTGRRKRIGNAVPPPTAYAIAQECMATLIASANGGFRLASGDVWVQPETGAIAA
jgi:site-specific DNA-cytosine methylase